jgi:hypothetical protein
MQIGFLAKALCFFAEKFFQDANFAGIASLVHAARPFRKRKAKARAAFSSPMEAPDRAVMLENMRANARSRTQQMLATGNLFLGLCPVALAAFAFEHAHCHAVTRIHHLAD